MRPCWKILLLHSSPQENVHQVSFLPGKMGSKLSPYLATLYSLLNAIQHFQMWPCIFVSSLSWAEHVKTLNIRWRKQSPLSQPSDWHPGRNMDGSVPWKTPHLKAGPPAPSIFLQIVFALLLIHKRVIWLMRTIKCMFPSSHYPYPCFGDWVLDSSFQVVGTK